MATVNAPKSVTIEVTFAELETIRVGLRHTVTYGTTAEEDRAVALLEDFAGHEAGE